MYKTEKITIVLILFMICQSAFPVRTIGHSCIGDFTGRLNLTERNFQLFTPPEDLSFHKIQTRLPAETDCDTLPVPTIMGSDSGCVDVDGNNYYTEAGMTNYSWNVSDGGVITFGQGTHSITIRWEDDGNQTVSVNYMTPDGCTALAPTVVVVHVDEPVPAGITISASSNPVCNGSAAVFTATVVDGGTSPGYQWKANGINIGTNSPVCTYFPANGDIITCQLTSNEMCVTGNPAGSNPITMSVTANLPVSVSITASSNPVCEGTSVTYNANPLNGGSSPDFQWKVNNINVGTNSPVYSYNPQNGDVVTCTMISSVACVIGNPAHSNSITMAVSPVLPVSITVSASSNPSCEGSLVIYSALPVNGGTNPSYQWSVNGSPSGSNNPAFSHVPANGDIITCVLTSNATCTTGNPSTSTPVIMTVSPSEPTSVSISTDSDVLCQGVPATYTAVIENGGNSPVYQWYVNGFDMGVIGPAFTYFPANGDVVTCGLISSNPCATGNPASSNEVTMTVHPNITAGISVSASANYICQGISVTYTATATNAGSTPVYQWKVNGADAGTNTNTYTYTPNNGDIVKCQLTSSMFCVTNNPASSNAISMVISQLNPVSVSIAASANPVCPGSTVSFTATAINGGPFPTYQWKVNGLIVGTNSPIFSYIPLNGDIVTCKLTSLINCAVGNPATSNQIVITSSENLPVSINVTPSANPVCQGQIVTFTATSSNGGTLPVYQWFINGIPVGAGTTSYSYTPANGDVVTCQVTSNLSCSVNNPATSVPVTMTVNQRQPVSILISSSLNPVCEGTSVTFTAVPVNGGTSPSFQWRVNGINTGANLPSYSYIPENNDSVTCQLTSSASCISGNPAISNLILMSVSPEQVVGVTIASSSNPFCPGDPVILTAVPSNGGTSPVFLWKLNGVIVGTNSQVFSYYPDDGDVVSCTLTSNATCITGNPAVQQITLNESTQVPVSVSISVSSNTICQGDTITLTANPINGGSTPSYQWVQNGDYVGTNSPFYRYVPSNGDQVSCQMFSSLTCATGNPASSNTISLTVNPIGPVSITISASANPSCNVDSVTFTASAINGGSSPLYRWKVNGIYTGTNSPVYKYVPLNGDSIVCLITSNSSCATVNNATSNRIVMIVKPLMPVSVMVSCSSNPVCLGIPVNYTAIPTNGGLNPSFQWYVNNIMVGDDQPVYSYIPAAGDMIKCRVTSDATCISGNPAMSNQVVMNVGQDLPVSVTVTMTPQVFCEGDIILFTATPTNGGSDPVYQWRVNGVVVGTDNATYSYLVVNGDIVTCEVNSNAPCASNNPAISNGVTIICIPNLPAAVTISATQTLICQGNNVYLTATGANCGLTPVYQWKVNNVNVGTNSPAFHYIPQNYDQITCEMISSLSCATPKPVLSNTITMSVLPLVYPTVSITASTNPCCQGSTITFTAIPVNGGTIPQYQWKVNGIVVGTSSPTYSYIPANGDIVSCRMSSLLACATGNANSNQIIMGVDPYLPVGDTITCPSDIVCTGTPVTYTSIATNGGSSPSYQWMVNGTNAGTNSSTFTYIPVHGDTVICRMTSSAACISGSPATSNKIGMGVFDELAVSVTVTSSANQICEGIPVAYNAIPVNSGFTPVYQWTVNNADVGTNNSTFSYTPANGDVVTCSLTSSLGCAVGNPAVSDPLTMIIYPNLPVGINISASENPACVGMPVTFSSVTLNGGSDPLYQWTVNGIPIGSNTTSFTFAPTNGDVIRCQITSNALCALGNPATSDSILVVTTPNLPVRATVTASANPVCQGNPVVFTSTPENGGTSPSYQWVVNGIITGGNTSSYTYIPVNGDSVKCIVNSSLTCITGNPFTSNTIPMSVSSNLIAVIDIAASSNPVCENTPVTFTSTTINAGPVPSFQWKVNGVNTGTDTPTLIYIPSDGDIVTCEMTSNASCVSITTVQSNPVLMNVSMDLEVGISIAPSANPVCQGSSVTFNAIPTAGGNEPTYQWTVNGFCMGLNEPQFSYTPTDGDIVACYLSSNATCVSANIAMSNQIVMTVNQNLPVSLTISPSANPVCQGSTVICIATPLNGGSTPSYQWKVNGSNVGGNSPFYSYIPTNGNIVTCVLTSEAACVTGNPANSNMITMTTSPNQAVSVSIAVTANPACFGNPVTFTATPVNGGSFPVYQWRVNGVILSSSGSLFTYIPTDGDIVTCRMTSNINCASGNPASSNPITMTVSQGFPVSVNITASSNPSCQGQMITYNAEPVYGGTSPSYQWLVNGIEVGTNSPSFAYSPSNGDAIRCLMTSNFSCAVNNPATSNQISMTVNQNIPVSVSIASSANPVCPATTVVYTATSINQGTNPFYQWKVNGINTGSNDSVLSYIPVNGDVVTCQLTSGISCVTVSPALSNPISMIVSTDLPVCISISGSTNNICQGTPVYFSSSSTNGGSSPVFQWKINGVNAGTNSPSFTCLPGIGDIITCQLTSSLSCATTNPATSNPVNMIVNPILPVSISISPSSNPSCGGNTVVFTAIAVNGGTLPQYQWKLNGSIVGGNSQTYAYQPSMGDIVTCSLTSNAAPCATGNPAMSNPVAMLVSTVPVVSFSSCNDTTAIVNSRPISLRGGLPFGGIYSGPGVNSATGMFDPLQAGTGTKVITYTYTNFFQCSSSNSRTMTVLPGPGFTCGQPLTDIRDNKVYATVLLDTMCWMAENLNFGNFQTAGQPQNDNCFVEKYCYENNENNCVSEGGLYQWDELMDYAGDRSTKGICPPGWHIPIKAEWEAVFQLFNTSAHAGSELLASGTSGFNALVSGVRHINSNWSFMGFATFHWSSTTSGQNKAWGYGTDNQDSSVASYPSSKINAFSVRCVKD